MLKKLIFIFCFTYVTAIQASEELFIESDLSITCKNFTVCFYHEVTSNNFYSIQPSNYSTVLICGTKPQIGELPLKKHKDELYYYCLDDEKKYKDLSLKLDELMFFFPNHLEEEKIPESHSLSNSISLEVLEQQIEQAKNVVVTFGAGMSAGYVPTLIEFFNTLKLEKVFSKDIATETSLTLFVANLLENKELMLKTIQSEWGKVYSYSIESTPAHKALKNLSALWQIQKKNVFIYTDNIDGIHHKMGILLSEQRLEEKKYTKIVYPPSNVLSEEKTVVLVCGQSFDFHGILSTIHTQKKKNKEISFYSINTCSNGINVYDGLDMEIMNDNDLVSECSLNQSSLIPLEMSLLQGSVHEILPELYEKLNQK